MTMPAGLWWIGDLCYVMHEEWDEVCTITCNANGVHDGEFSLGDGRRFALYSTAYGDGCYDGLSVDSGSLGCILLSDINQSIPSNNTSSGRLVEFDFPFDTSSENGAITFGSEVIDTSGNLDESDEDEEIDQYD